MLNNPEIDLAWDFVNHTDRNIFLTGKAGTGKTTFLHKLKEQCLKRLVVVAPTGVAAINAGGVTIHSFFQLPFGPLLPENGTLSNNSFSKKFSRAKIDIIKSLDLLIIDEISMVRADVLDGIDNVLRRFRNRSLPFGGVQLLMIGDLQQLSPVIKENEWQLLKQNYKTGFFFGSHAFQKCDALSIELKHIYRQDSKEFIEILNEIRNDRLSLEASEKLNQRYLPDFSATEHEGYITLTTHNARADRINNTELHTLKDKSFVYEAEVIGKFPEYLYPTHINLELKVGAQVMFIKNDRSPEKEYFNGKIGTVVHLEEDDITVRCPDDDFDIHLIPEEWENVKYSIDPDTKEITEEKIGAFTQIPLRLAWAITIHKSQGLTFDKVVVDAQEAFAHGQTYVALSRCKTLEGIVLTSPISNSSIINNQEVSVFSKQAEKQQPDVSVLEISEKTYQLNLLDELFNFHSFLYPIKRITDIYYKNRTGIEGTVLTPLQTLKEKGVQELLKIHAAFKKQLKQLSEKSKPDANPALQERVKKACAYFETHTEKFIKNPLADILYSTDNKTVRKELNKYIDDLEQQTHQKLYVFRKMKVGFDTVSYLKLRAEAVLEKPNIPQRRKETLVTTTEHPALYDELRNLRTELSETEAVAPYQIFTQKTLMQLCQLLPTTPKQLKSIHGIGKVRLEKYGAAILKTILAYCETHDAESKKDVLAKSRVSETKKISFKLFKEGMSIAEIAAERGFTTGTIEGHLSGFIRTGDLMASDLMPELKYKELREIMETTPFEGFKQLKDQVDDTFSYMDLRFVFNEMEYEKNKE
ncbi:helix-turn-helix domain-containing protein [Marixanthomonas spongiae]|uniref:Helicase n=1 Tax=Marixanthomonas spongiae TaxID=2174845 RepID=A0A2U0HYN9_9FLAO|nr:helix-turn-helix domain-containing protein [Marixanthomonas spongiae]PVW13957.1 helicase [Marixanthomonas spongiae]